MIPFIEVLTGPLMGKKFKVESGLTIGRREGTVVLESDSKASGLHAKIEADNKDQLVLVDQSSANGIILNERRVKRVAMIPGVRFRVGETLFLVLEMNDVAAEGAIPSLSWQDEIDRCLRKEPAENRQIDGAAQTFTPPVQLLFTQGIQAEETYVLGYGPRAAGLGHLDINLKDPAAPELAFEILPGPGSALFRDRSRGKIRINQKRPETETSLEEGDEISLGTTLIRVRYL